MKRMALTAAIGLSLTGCGPTVQPPVTLEQFRTPEENAAAAKTDAMIEKFQKDHPLRPSQTLDSVLHSVRVLGNFEASARSYCSIDPNFPEWTASASSLHENTKVALQQSFAAGSQESAAAYVVLTSGTDVCLSSMDHAFSTLKELPDLFADLKKHGY